MNIVGNERLVEVNGRGEKVTEWCKEKYKITMNTSFTKHPRKLWTWKCPDGLMGIKLNTSQSIGDAEALLEIFPHIKKEIATLTTTCLLEL